MYAHESQQAHSDQTARRDNERLGFVVHELRNLVNTAFIAFEVLKSGNVGVGGSTGAVLNRSLIGLRDLIARSLEEVRSTIALTDRKQIMVSEVIDEIARAALLEANARNLKSIVPPVQDGLAIDADKPVLAAVVLNLLQDAFKFTRPQTTVT